MRSSSLIHVGGAYAQGHVHTIISEAAIKFDHIVPVAESCARFDEAIVRLAHRGCNRSRRRKQTTTPEGAFRAERAPPPPWMLND
jgi:hypothetical protein